MRRFAISTCERCSRMIQGAAKRWPSWPPGSTLNDYPDFVTPLGRPVAAGQIEHDHVKILCVGGRTAGPAVAWDLVQTFLAAEFSQAERHLRRLGKVASLEAARSGQ
jgi:hypothetical protein